MLPKLTCCILPIVLSCTLFGAGCDPVRTTMQPVRLRVITASAGQPVAGANVQLKAPYGGRSEQMRVYTDEEWLDQSIFPRHSGATDELGIAEIDFTITEIDRSIGPWNAPDRVSGAEYICRVVEGDRKDVFRVTMDVGASVRGESFMVTIEDIGESRYVELE